MSFCPECEAIIEEEFEEVGELFTCPECGVDLEVISIDPLEFDLAPIEDEEEDDFGFDDEDDEDEWDDGDSYDEDIDEKDDY